MRARRWTVAQIGPREEYAAARAMAQDGRLARLYTDMWCGRLASALSSGPAALRKLALRSHADLRDSSVVAWNVVAATEGARRALERRRGLSRHDEFLHHGAWFDGQVERHLRRQRLDADEDVFFSFNTGCLGSLRHLRSRGVPAVVDQIDPARIEFDLVRAEAERWPGWADDHIDVPGSYFDHMQEEWAAATGVVVNSSWSADALVRQGVPRERIAVVPLAYEPPRPPARGPREPGEPLTVLWLGSVILRKGIQYLVEAAHLLADRSIRFVVVGPVGISQSAVASAPASVQFKGGVTHDRVTEEYRAADVFVLPTISDGFALTQLEAMAHGLPVIATPNCGEVVTQGRDGLLVPAADAEALAAALATLDDDRDLLDAMAERACHKAGQFSLGRYRDELDAAVATLVKLDHTA